MTVRTLSSRPWSIRWPHSKRARGGSSSSSFWSSRPASPGSWVRGSMSARFIATSVAWSIPPGIALSTTCLARKSFSSSSSCGSRGGRSLSSARESLICAMTSTSRKAGNEGGSRKSQAPSPSNHAPRTLSSSRLGTTGFGRFPVPLRSPPRLTINLRWSAFGRVGTGAGSPVMSGVQMGRRIRSDSEPASRATSRTCHSSDTPARVTAVRAKAHLPWGPGERTRRYGASIAVAVAGGAAGPGAGTGRGSVSPIAFAARLGVSALQSSRPLRSNGTSVRLAGTRKAIRLGPDSAAATGNSPSTPMAPASPMLCGANPTIMKASALGTTRTNAGGPVLLRPRLRNSKVRSSRSSARTTEMPVSGVIRSPFGTPSLPGASAPP